MHHTAQNPVIQKPVQTVEKNSSLYRKKMRGSGSQFPEKMNRPVGQDYIRILFPIFWSFMETAVMEMILQSLVESRGLRGFQLQ